MSTIVSKAKAYLKVRHKTVRDALKQLNLDAMIVSHVPDVSYLTNFTGEDSLVVVTAKEFLFVTDFRYKEQAELECGWQKIYMREGKMSDSLAQVLADAKPKRVGYDVNSTTVGQLRAIELSLKEKGISPMPELVGTENVLVNIRKVKDDHEIDLIRKSVAIAEEAFEALRTQIKVGLSENYLAGSLLLELRSRGASDAAFAVIVAAAANASKPHYHPGEALVQKDQPLLIDWGALYKGYCSDLTRTLMVGRVSDRIRKIYHVVEEAQKAVVNFLRPGVTTTQADRIGREVIERAGFGEQFGHGMGHGIGLEIHEQPFMRKTGEGEELRPGMIITVEPGIYLPGEGGVRIEDDVLITHSGCEMLSNLDRTFEGCRIG